MKPWLMGSMAFLLVAGSGQQPNRTTMLAAIDSLVNAPIKAGRLAGGRLR